MKKLRATITLSFFAAGAALILASCNNEPKTDAEEVADEIGDAIEEVADEVEDATR